MADYRQLQESLHVYKPFDNREDRDVKAVLALIAEQPTCFHRYCFKPGHITGSALLINQDGSKVLMNHHKFLKRWFCFGGHADGETDILNVARREIIEESGITDIQEMISGIFDVDVHHIPANEKKKEPEHSHFDIRYIFKTNSPSNFVMSDESIDMKWCNYDEAVALSPPEEHSRMIRMLNKWQRLT